MKVAHLTTVDMSLRYLVFPQLKAALEYGESVGISAPGDYVDELERSGIRHVALKSSTRGMSLAGDLRAALELRRILIDERPDILHTHNPKPGLYGRIVGRLCGVPIVVNTVHGLYASQDAPWLKRTVVYLAEFIASRFSDAELIQSPEDFELMTRMHLTPSKRTWLLGNGVDLTRFTPEAVAAHREAVREELGLGDEDILVGMVGRLVREKGIPELIDVAERLPERYVLSIVGPFDPEKSDAVDDATIKRGKEAGVRFLGMRKDIERLYGAFDLFVLPSHREGFPRAAMEAAAAGLPIVATDIRGCRQVVDDGVNGYLCEVGDAGCLLRRITEIGDDPALRRRMARASVLKARDEFDEQQVVRIVMDTYRTVARRKGFEWAFETAPGEEVVIEDATLADVTAVARLHARMIATGFLSKLGVRFLSVLYRAMVRDPYAELLVARDGDMVLGFIAGTWDTNLFYKSFARRNLFAAVAALFPAILRPSVWMGVVESLRYGVEGSDVPAELLSMAVAPVARRRGVGSRLVEGLIGAADGRGVSSIKVVVGSENSAAVSFYRDCGFEERRTMAVHEDAPSLEMVWSGQRS